MISDAYFIKAKLRDLKIRLTWDAMQSSLERLNTQSRNPPETRSFAIFFLKENVFL